MSNTINENEKKYASLESLRSFKENADKLYATQENVDEISSTLEEKANTLHTHDISDVTNLESILNINLETAKSYTDTKTSSLASTTVVDNKISTHNTSTSTHNDIRALITDLTTKLNNFLDVDDTTTDQLSEVLTLIKNNKGTLESLTTSKINVSDIVNNLTTNNTSKVLSAAQGVIIQSLIDALQEEIDTHGHEISDIVNLQTALDGKQATITGGASTIASSNLTSSRALVSDGYGKVAVSAVTSTEIGYLDGVTSAIQSQLDGKAASSHTHTILKGQYTRDGGSQPPSYVGTNAVKCNMMNQFVGTSTSFESFADVLQMNAYSWSDVPYATALAIQKTDGVPKAWIAAGGNTDKWAGATEIITKNNIGSQFVNYATSAGSASSATKATQDASGNIITSTYATKTELDTAKSTLQTQLDGKSDISHTHYYAHSSHVGGGANFLEINDTRDINDTPEEIKNLMSFIKRGARLDFKQASIMGLDTENGNFATVLSISPWADWSGGNNTQLAFRDDGRIQVRKGDSSGWTDWNTLATKSDIPDYITTGAMSGTTIGDYATAEGYENTASGDGSHAEGAGNTASGNGSHAEGFENTASGVASHAQGCYNTASGVASHAGGFETVAKDYQYVIGKYNKDTTAPTSLADTTASAGLFIVGIGTGASDRKNGFRVNPAGKVYGTGTYGTSGADYAEYFEWFDGNPNNEDRRGHFVTLEGDKIRYATPNDDYILGVVSADPSVAGDIHSEDWHNRYLKDVFGSKIVEVVEVGETTDENGEIIPAHTERRWVLNPDYNPNVKYTSREERPEWEAIGIVGKLVVVDDGTCQVNEYCYPSIDGIATASKEKTNYRVMERLDDTHIRIFIR